MTFLFFPSNKFSNLLLTIFLALVFSNASVYSQVKIKEKIGIKPNTLLKNVVNTSPDWYFDFGYLTNANPVSIISYFEHDSTVNNLYRITFVSGADFQFSYGWWEQELLGDTLIISGYALSGYSIGRGVYWGITLLNPYQGITPQSVTMKVESIDWHSYEVIRETRYYDLTILPDNFTLGAENYIYTAVVGKKVNAEIFIGTGSNTPPLTIPPNTIKLNLEIIRGAYLGDIEISEKNLIGKVINNVDHEEGKLKFSFVANGNLALDEDTVIIRVSSSYPNIDDPKKKDFVFVIMKYEPLEVTFIPSTLAPGDTANIIVKKRNSDGTLTDFCADQWFDIEITGGADYGSFFIPEWNDTTDQTQFVNQGFKFLATKPVPQGSVQPTILVKTSGQIATSIIPTDTGQNDEKFNLLKKSPVLYETIQQISKMNSALSTEHLIQKNNLAINKSKTINNNGDCILWDSIVQLWGTATITIADNDSNRTLVKAYFEKPNLVPGDTVNVIIKKVDSNGNETDYPASTQFEVGIKEGCEFGNILASSGTIDKFFSRIPEPIRFVVADSVNIDSAIVVLRVGAPKMNEGEPPIQLKKIEQSVLIKSKTNAPTNTVLAKTTNAKIMAKVTNDDYCVVGNYTYTNVDFPVGEIDNVKIKIILTGQSKVWPYRTSDSTITNVKVKVTNGNQPLANQRVKITIKRIDRSGGHDHPNSSDLTLWGRISVNGVKGNPVTAYTDQNGEITTEEIRASEFGGEYFIEAYLESKPSIKDKVNYIVRVPELSLLPENSSYIKTGGTDKHFGPPSSITDNNHWVNPIALSSLVNGAVEFLQATWNRNQERMRINDIGLPFGGLFDINGTWRNPHISHRTGKDVDIENGNRLLRLKEVLNNKGWTYIPEGPGFYPHFRFNR